MEKFPNNKIDDETNKEQAKEKAKKIALEKVRQKVAIVNIEEIAEAEARKGADAYMTEDKASGLKKWWKHTVAEGFYRGREVTRVKKEIKETGNIYTRRIGDNPTKPAHESAMKAISDRFISEYEDELVLSKGEQRKFLDDKDQDVVKVKTDLKNLLDSYAMGSIDDETFNNNKKGIINSLKGKEELFKGADNYADNLLEIAKNAKIAYEHGAKLGELDYDLGMIIGKAKSSLKTEAHFNLIDKSIDRMKKSKVGRYISPTVLSTGVGIGYSVITGVSALASTKLGQVVGGIGSLGISVGISTAFAAANESQRVADEGKQARLDDAEGGEDKPGNKRREQIARFRYEMEKSINLSQRLRDLMFEKDKDGNDVVKDIKEGDVQDIITCLANIDARKSLNQTKNIDLISYSNIGNVEKESTDLTILTAQAKFELEKRVKTDLKDGIPQGVGSYEEYLESVTNTVKDSLLGGEKGINAQDKAFRRYKAGRVITKAAITATVGIIVGGTIRELLAIGSDHVQSLFNNPDGTTAVTPARHLWDIMTGNQTHMDMGNSVVTHVGNLNLEVPEGVSVLQNGDGIDIIKGGQIIDHFIPKLDANGALDPDVVAKLAHDGILSSSIHNVINSTQEVATDANGWIQNHPGETIQVHHNDVGPFMDNNTPSVPDPANPGHMLGADGNELGMRWGGPDGSGINTNGDAILNISHMDAIHSVHGDVSVDVPTEMHNGNLMALVYLNGGGQGIPVEVQPNGDIIFDHNNPIMQQVFKLDANGHMTSCAKVIELVQKMGVDENGVQQIRAISALPGEGLNNIKDIIPWHDDIVVNTIIPPADVQNPLYVPFVSRKPLEPVIFGGKEKKKEEDKNEKGTEGGDKKIFEPIPVGGIKEEKSGNRKTDEFKKEVLFASIYKAKIFKEFEDFVKNKPTEKIPTELEEKYNEAETHLSEIQKASTELAIASKKEREVFGEFETFVANSPEIPIPKTLENRYRKAEERLARAQKEWERVEAENKKLNITEEEIKTSEENKENATQEEKTVEETKENTSEKNVPEPQETEKSTIETNTAEENTNTNTNINETATPQFELKDLFKVGTKFESEEGSFTVTKIRTGWFKKPRVEAIYRDENGKDHLVSYSKKDLEKEFEKENIKITKAGN